MNKIIIIAALLTFSSALSFSQSLTNDRPDSGNWWMYFGTFKLNDKYSIHGEVQYRNYNFLGELEQLLIRTGLNYHIPDSKAILTMGYGYILSEPLVEISPSITEHRIFQQFIMNQNVGRFYFSHRYRIEERWIENSDFRWRFRYFLAINVPLNTKVIEPKTWYLSLYNEIFLNGETPIFDRNRLYGGVGLQVSPSAKIQFGYMSQIQDANSRPQLQFSLFHNL